ncbi:hypothetical protein EJ08DRAFT_650401 [Tothia fuscella]|uniref:Uncharacterized protein n=1 Tax=Tothia fuscella TaxID=1048955 RepID=A0A9P4NPZ6_9PEZI|nr:hypothetical protein EJ08DRAFT_650401 [Tothia fuscella]
MPAIAVSANGLNAPAPAPAPTTELHSPVDSTNSTAPSKRKRSSTADAPQANGASEPPAQAAEQIEQDPLLPEVLTDILTVLSNYDTTPSILTTKLPSHRSASSEPNAKRTKLSQSPASTISDKLRSGAYVSLDALVKDVDAVASAMLEPLKTKEAKVPSYPSGRTSMLNAQETRLSTGILAFQKTLEEIVHAEKQRANSRHPEKAVKKDNAVTNGITVKMEHDDNIDDNGRSVLTVYANAQVPKQLFSSFQKPVRFQVSNKLAPPVQVATPLRETGLPNFISTTKIPPVEVEDVKATKVKAPKLGELFAPPSSLPRLQPPKPSRKTTTGNTLTFVPHDRPTRPARRNSYNWSAAQQSVGQWLGYGGVDVPLLPTSPSAKRKQRDRALSTGEAQIVLSDSEKLALKKAEDDALFRRVYGSFAPSHDNSSSVVPEETRNEIWWNKLGERFAQRTILVDPALLEEDAVEGATAEDQEQEAEDFKDAVESFDAEELGLDKLPADQTEDKEIDEILVDISNELERLASYQRVRNSYLASSSSTTVGQNSPLTNMIGSPSTPSTAEVEVYKTLKAQLAVMILNLPPYAVARLNGDQLEELNIKTNIIVETENPRGVMAEDEASRVAKQQAYAAASGPVAPPLNRASSSNYSNHSGINSYHRTPVAPATARPGSYFPQSTGNNRTAQIPYNRSASGVQTYSAGYPTTTPRPSHNTQQNNYNHSSLRGGGGYQQQAQTGSNQYYQTLPHVAAGGASAKAGAGYNSQYQGGTPHTQTRGGYQQTPTTTSYGRTGTAPVAPQFNYPATASPSHRMASPLTAATNATPANYNQSTPRPSYTNVNNTNTPTAQSQNRSSYYSTANVNANAGQQGISSVSNGGYNTPTTSAGAGAGAIGPSGFHTSMTALEQQSMLTRVQQQQQARMGAQQGNSSNNAVANGRQPSGTPVSVPVVGQGH